MDNALGVDLDEGLLKWGNTQECFSEEVKYTSWEPNDDKKNPRG